jgi:hypothetical protein
MSIISVDYGSITGGGALNPTTTQYEVRGSQYVDVTIDLSKQYIINVAPLNESLTIYSCYLNKGNLNVILAGTNMTVAFQDSTTLRFTNTTGSYRQTICINQLD